MLQLPASSWRNNDRSKIKNLNCFLFSKEIGKKKVGFRVLPLLPLLLLSLFQIFGCLQAVQMVCYITISEFFLHYNSPPISNKSEQICESTLSFKRDRVVLGVHREQKNCWEAYRNNINYVVQPYRTLNWKFRWDVILRHIDSSNNKRGDSSQFFSKFVVNWFQSLPCHKYVVCFIPCSVHTKKRRTIQVRPYLHSWQLYWSFSPQAF